MKSHYFYNKLLVQKLEKKKEEKEKEKKKKMANFPLRKWFSKKKKRKSNKFKHGRNNEMWNKNKKK